MTITTEQIRTRGLAALQRELGRAGLVRFLQHYEAGEGDYTRQRPELLADLTIDNLREHVARPKKKPKVKK